MDNSGWHDAGYAQSLEKEIVTLKQGMGMWALPPISLSYCILMTIVTGLSWLVYWRF